MKTVKIKIINNNIYNYCVLPKRMTPGSAGLDLFACINCPIILYPNKTHLISTGIAIHINDTEIVGIILPRSGIGHNHGIILGNSVGVIDSDYQGELFISLWNREEKQFIITPGYRIAQLLFFSIILVNFSVVTSFHPTSTRGTKGFGHSM